MSTVNPHGWDAFPSQGYPSIYVAGTYLYTRLDGVRQCGVKCLV